ncbi:hypothetical protein ACFYO9_37650 [Streptomyces sp. NPDC005863]|uniref:hypothetical protein n=1 Tax=Streptomyces sp. NPDC005863 TaxID=3364735 RepID=UPI003675A9C1
MTFPDPILPPAPQRDTVARLEAELRQYKDIVARQDELLRALQTANEGAYRDQYDAAGGPHLCPAHPLGETVARPRPGIRDLAGGAP